MRSTKKMKTAIKSSVIDCSRSVVSEGKDGGGVLKRILQVFEPDTAIGQVDSQNIRSDRYRVPLAIVPFKSQVVWAGDLRTAGQIPTAAATKCRVANQRNAQH